MNPYYSLLFSVNSFQSKWEKCIDSIIHNCFSYMKLWSNIGRNQDLPTHTKLTRWGLKWKAKDLLRVWPKANEKKLFKLLLSSFFWRLKTIISLWLKSPNALFKQPLQLLSSILFLVFHTVLWPSWQNALFYIQLFVLKTDKNKSEESNDLITRHTWYFLFLLAASRSYTWVPA